MATQTLSATDRTRKIRVWDLPLRLFHWFLVAAIALAFLSSEEGSPLSDWHIASGWIAMVLIVFRIFWGLVGGEHSRWSDFTRFRSVPTLGHNPLGALSVLVLLALAAAVVWTGAAFGDAGEESHELLARTLLGLIAVHVVAVVVMSVLSRENLVSAMITGRKPAERHPDAHDARRPQWYGFVVAALGVGGTIYAVRTFDPLAFTPRSVEAYGQGSEMGQPTEAGHEVEADEEGGDDDN
jgi:cytochrome b